jgi:hypothetical protein
MTAARRGSSPRSGFVARTACQMAFHDRSCRRSAAHPERIRQLYRLGLAALKALWRTYSQPKIRPPASTLLFNCASFSATSARISFDISSSFSHCSLYRGHRKASHPVDGDCSLFAYLHADTGRRRAFLQVSFSFRRRSSSSLRSSSDYCMHSKD